VDTDSTKHQADREEAEGVYIIKEYHTYFLKADYLLGYRTRYKEI
jgi:hypothetical protein